MDLANANQIFDAKGEAIACLYGIPQNVSVDEMNEFVASERGARYLPAWERAKEIVDVLNCARLLHLQTQIDAKT
jgi:hypothetical protein